MGALFMLTNKCLIFYLNELLGMDEILESILKECYCETAGKILRTAL